MELSATLVAICKKVLDCTDEEAAIILSKTNTDHSRVKLVSQLRFLNYIWQVQENSFIFRAVGTVALTESMNLDKSLSKQEQFTEIVEKHFSIGDKQVLLDHFLFSKVHGFRDENVQDVRHLMYKKALEDLDYKNKHFFGEVSHCASESTVCFCSSWLAEHTEHVNEYTRQWCARIYEIRNAVVHEASPAGFLPEWNQPEDVASFSSSLFDTYPLLNTSEVQFRNYESSLKPEQFKNIFHNGIKSFLLTGFEDGSAVVKK